MHLRTDHARGRRKDGGEAVLAVVGPVPAGRRRAPGASTRHAGDPVSMRSS
jgi:hypothetical protein